MYYSYYSSVCLGVESLYLLKFTCQYLCKCLKTPYLLSWSQTFKYRSVGKYTIDRSPYPHRRVRRSTDEFRHYLCSFSNGIEPSDGIHSAFMTTQRLCYPSSNARSLTQENKLRDPSMRFLQNLINQVWTLGTYLGFEQVNWGIWCVCYEIFTL